MKEYIYKYQNYLRNDEPLYGPVYTSFLVALEMQIEKTAPIESAYYPAELMAEIGWIKLNKNIFLYYYKFPSKLEKDKICSECDFISHTRNVHTV